MMFSSSKNKDKAWEVIKYFSSEEFLKGYLEAGLNLPISSYMDGIIDKTKTGRLADFALTDYESVYSTVPSPGCIGSKSLIMIRFTFPILISFSKASLYRLFKSAIASSALTFPIIAFHNTTPYGSPSNVIAGVAGYTE